MDVKELKNYIYENQFVEQILDSIGCHHIRYHSTYWTCANADGDNNNAITVYNNEFLSCVNYTRQMIKVNRQTDIVDLVCYSKNLAFPNGLKFICDEIGMSYYHDFEEDMPESFKLLNLLEDMSSNYVQEKEQPLKPIPECILSYYQPFVNKLFFDDNITYATQREFEIGFDTETNRYTIPIRSELGDLVGVKGRYFYQSVPENEMKYLYLEPCVRSKVIYGLNKTIGYVKQTGRIFIVEAEKAVLQLWSYGYQNSGATGGKKMSQYQIDLLVRLGATIIFAFDKDVEKKELEELADRFPEGIPLYYLYDEDNILSEKESPSDNPEHWEYMVKHNIYRLR